MAHNNIMTPSEGSSMNRPPLFDGNDYPYWRDKMTLFIQFSGYDIWKIITEGNQYPEEEVTTTSSLGITSTVTQRVPEARWTHSQKEMFSLNAKAKFMLICALTKNEYNKIIACETAEEIWDRLQLHHEGSDDVK